MDVSRHFESLTRELEALRDRVRNFSVWTPHWPTDGEWKESVLRAVLKAYLPAHIEPLRGFVVTPRSGSSQIDILLYDNRKPVLFRNGDLVFVTPDAVSGIIEVKSAIRDRSSLREALQSLSRNAELIRGSGHADEDLFVGLFSYETDLQANHHKDVREELQNASHGCLKRVVSYVCLGCSHFAVFWRSAPDGSVNEDYNHWHSYELPDCAAGYFVNNVVAAVSGKSVQRNAELWFPSPSKELRRLGSSPLRPA